MTEVKNQLREIQSTSHDLDRKLQLLDNWVAGVKALTIQKISSDLIATIRNEFGGQSIGVLVALTKVLEEVPRVPTADAARHPVTPTHGTKKRSCDDANSDNDDCARKQFVTKYVTPRGGGMSTVDLLNEEIDQLIADSKEQNMAPFIFLLQSMGYGKTRAMLELAHQKRRVVFLPCRNLPALTDGSKSWKVPGSLQEMLHILRYQVDDNICESKWDKFLKAVQDSAEPYKTSKELFNAQLTEGGKLGPFYQALVKKYFPSPVKSQPVPPSACRTPTAESPSEEQTKKVSISPGNKFDLGYSNAKPVTEESLIVCLDEATALSGTSLKAFRRAAKMLGIITVFSDTTASISKVMEANDASCSSMGGKLGQFTRPLYELPTFDLNYNVSAGPEDLENLLTAGRPRWFSLLQAFQEQNQEKSEQAAEENLMKLIEVVKSFLLRESFELDTTTIPENIAHSVGNIQVIKPSMVAMFSCRFGLGSRSTIAPLLAKYCLATIDHVTSNRDSVSTHYPSEPVLAEASAQYTSADTNNLFRVLNHVHAAVLQDILDPPRGDLGEMCAAALLGFTMDKIRKERNHRMFCSDSVDLKSLLSYFGCKNVEEVDKALDGWKVNFTHFDRPGNLDDRDLKVMWYRRTAYYAIEGMNGLDLLIAIWHKRKGYATLRVQVKNFAKKFQKSKRDVALRKLEPRRCPPNARNEKFSVGLLLCVNSVDEHCHLLDYNNPRKKIWPRAERSSPRPGEQPEGGNGQQEKLLLQIVSSFPEKRNNSDQVTDEVHTISEKLKKICEKSHTDEERWHVNWPLLQSYRQELDESPPVPKVTDGSPTESPTKTDSTAESVVNMDVESANGENSN